MKSIAIVSLIPLALWAGTEGTPSKSAADGLKDFKMTARAKPDGKDAIIKFLGDSFDYLSAVIATLTDEQLSQVHPSPDGRLTGRDILLAIYGDMAHHRG